MAILNRAFKALSLNYYNGFNAPEMVEKIVVKCTKYNEYILRMLIKRPFEGFQLPPVLDWAQPLILTAISSQQEKGIEQPFVYLTVRHGFVSSINDDVWHVDGFSMNITHLPEQNYIWCDKYPTEYVAQPIKFPQDFDPKKHNIHSFIQRKITAETKTMLSYMLYCLDPYVIHRRPNNIPDNECRTFVRISFTPIEIMDDNNTLNPLIKVRKYSRDGVKDVREKLIDY